MVLLFYTLGGGPKAGLGGPWLSWALPEVSAMQHPWAGQLCVVIGYI